MCYYIRTLKGDFFMIKSIISRQSFGLLMAIVTVFALVSPFAAFADMRPVFDKIDHVRNQRMVHGDFPKSEVAQPRLAFDVTVTAYSSDPWQTDDTPFITASGTHVRDGIIAANFLPIGTRVRLPDLYGDKIFIVEDRMNKRYHYHADVWMSETIDAVNFGVEYTTIEIF
jgi:3D (Asp-Asp-Asp) domain-containing protein